MRRVSLLLILLPSCASERPSDDVVPRYAVLATFGPESPMYPAVERLARRRFGRVLSFRTLEEDAGRLREWLAEVDPAYVAVVLRPEELDPNFHLAFFEMSCRLDPDPFPDFAWGYFLAADPASLRKQIDTLEYAEARVEHRLLRMTHFEPGALESSESALRIAWATGLACRVISIKAGDRESWRRNIAAVEQTDFLLLGGEGGPEGIAGLPRDDVERLRLDSSVVFSGASRTGAAGAVFETSGDVVRRRNVPPEKSFAHALLLHGAVAAFAPLDFTNPALIAFEWSDAILSGGPLGGTLKRSYDLSVLSAGAAAPSFERFREGERPPAGRDAPLFLAATRVLYGDPLFLPSARDHAPPVETIGATRSEDAKKRPVLTLTDKVGAPDCHPYFADPFSSDQRIYRRYLLPPGTRGLEGARLEARPAPARLAAFAFEEWRGRPYAHVLIRGKDLAREDQVLEIALTLR